MEHSRPTLVLAVRLILIGSVYIYTLSGINWTIHQNPKIPIKIISFVCDQQFWLILPEATAIGVRLSHAS